MKVASIENPLVSSFSIIIDGSPLSVDAETHIVSITVDKDTTLPDMFTLNLISGVDQQEAEFSWIDDRQLFAIGHTVEVKMGYADELETLIIGEITGLEPEFVFDREPSLIVRGYDRRHRLQRGRKTRTFAQQKDSDIAEQIASEAGFTAQTEDSQVVHEYVLQANQTDMEFLQTRAQKIQYEVVVDDKTLFFRPVANAESEALTITLGDDLLEFFPRLSSIGQVNEVEVRSWDPKEKQDIIGRAKTGDEASTMGGQDRGAALSESAFGTSTMMVSDRPVTIQAEADQLAKAFFNQRVLTLITGEGVCRGRTDLSSGKVIKIDGVGKRFSGQYYVTSTSHRYNSRGYYTHFTVRRSAL